MGCVTSVTNYSKLATTTLSDYKLFVGGGVISDRIKVLYEGVWPDYVFSSEYTLMPLSKVEEYINANHHLPNVPSAEAIKKDGVDMGEMNAKLLEKIEELTLYTIEQQKELESQRALIMELAKKLAEK